MTQGLKINFQNASQYTTVARVTAAIVAVLLLQQQPLEDTLPYKILLRVASCYTGLEIVGNNLF